MPCRSGVEDNNGVLHRLDMPDSEVVPMRIQMNEHPFDTYFMISAKLMASSTPGIANARSCIMLPIIPFESAYGDVRTGCTGRVPAKNTHIAQPFPGLHSSGRSPSQIGCRTH